MSQNPSPTSVGQQLARCREELDLTQEALARRIGIATPTVSVTERGHTEIRLSKRPAWEKALGLKAGTISRAYRDGTPIELADITTEPPYADLSDRYERAIWEMALSEDDRRTLIDLLRKGREQDERGRRRLA
jgi:transcriptional regulator with XRE-family HTH domain